MAKRPKPHPVPSGPTRLAQLREPKKPPVGERLVQSLPPLLSAHAGAPTPCRHWIRVKPTSDEPKPQVQHLLKVYQPLLGIPAMLVQEVGKQTVDEVGQ